VRRWYGSTDGAGLYVSSLAIGELTQGVHMLSKRDEPKARGSPSGWAVSRRRMRSGSCRSTPSRPSSGDGGEPLFSVPVADGLMAATAYVNDWAFVTRNVKDIERTGVRVVDPFDPDASSS
jgi:toxin FitB